MEIKTRSDYHPGTGSLVGLLFTEKSCSEKYIQYGILEIPRSISDQKKHILYFKLCKSSVFSVHLKSNQNYSYHVSK